MWATIAEGVPQSGQDRIGIGGLVAAAVAVAVSTPICRTCSRTLERMGQTEAGEAQNKTLPLTPVVLASAVEDLLEMVSLEVVGGERVGEARGAVSYGTIVRTVAHHTSEYMDP